MRLVVNRLEKIRSHLADLRGKGVPSTAYNRTARTSAVLVPVVAVAASLIGIGVPPQPAWGATGSGLIVHTPVTTASYGQPISLSATTSCDSTAACPLTLIYRATGNPDANPPIADGPWLRVPMTLSSTRVLSGGEHQFDWTGMIDAASVTTTGVDYYLETTGTGQLATSPPSGTVASYHVSTVAPPLVHHLPPGFATVDHPLELTAGSSCSTGNCQATLYYRGSGASPNDALSGEPDWPHVTMSVTSRTALPVGGEDWEYSATVPADAVTTAGVDYLIAVSDGRTAGWWPGTTYEGYDPMDGQRLLYAHVHALEPSHIVHQPILTSAYNTDIPVMAAGTCPTTRTCRAYLSFRTAVPNTNADDGLLEDELSIAAPSNPFQTVPMTVTRSGASAASSDLISMTGTIPSRVVDTRGVDYYLTISDGDSTAYWPGTSRVDSFGGSDGFRIGFQHTHVTESPHLVTTTPPMTSAGQPYTISTTLTCATGNCSARLHYTSGLLGASPVSVYRSYTRLAMTPTGPPVATPSGTEQTLSATIPAKDVTTGGLSYFIDATDGYTTTFDPADAEHGAYLPGEALELSRNGSVDPGTLQPNELSYSVVRLAAATAGVEAQGDFARVVRVLEPPHVVPLPHVVVPKGVAWKFAATANCSYDKCPGLLFWQTANGEWNSVLAKATKQTAAAGGSQHLWSYQATVPASDTLGSQLNYYFEVSDGHISDSTPTLTAAVVEPPGGSIAGRAWYDANRDGSPSANEPIASGLSVEVRTAGLDGIPGTLDDVKVAGTKTGTDGLYKINGLAPGTYRVNAPNAPPGGAPLSTAIPVTVGLNQAVTGANLTYSVLDSDSDSVPDAVEIRLGLDPAAGADTDHDGITDKDELRTAAGTLSPGIADSDHNGTADGLDDADGDGIINATEIQAGTDPLNADTDGDGLSDSRERTLGSDPLLADTDNDGLNDRFEVAAGTSPTVGDSDNDGTPDAAEALTTTRTTAGVTVQLTGQGALDEHLRVTHLAANDVPRGPGQIGNPVDIHLDDAAQPGFQHAIVTLPYDPSQVSHPQQLRLFTLNSDLNAWVPSSPTQSVDTTTHTVSATVNHFSLYALFDEVVWSTAYDDASSTNSTAAKAVDAVLTIDSSSSMASNDPDDQRKIASDQFVDSLAANEGGGVVDFDDSASLKAALTASRAEAHNAIASIDHAYGTDLTPGIDTALTEIETHGRSDHRKVIILITDGGGPYDPGLSQRAVSDDVTIYTVGLGADNESLLQSIAADTGGWYFHLDDSSQLSNLLRNIRLSVDGQDTDGDGVPDIVETDGAFDSVTATFITSDPNNPDTDGDGITDGEEVHDAYDLSAEQPYDDDLSALLLAPTGAWIVSSNPRQTDSDADGLTDYDEVEQGTDPRSTDHDGDGLGDDAELNLGTDASNSDTDGDGYSDSYETDHGDQGFDELTYTHTQSKLDYVKDFACGATIGDFNVLFIGCDQSSVAWLAGDIASGFLAVGNIRDAISALIHLDFVGVGLNVLGILPIAGDAVDVASKVAKFILHNENRAEDALRLLKGADDATEIVAKTLKHVDPDMLARIQAKGISDTTLARLVEDGTNPALLDRTLSAVAKTDDVVTGRYPPFTNWRAGEDAISYQISDVPASESRASFQTNEVPPRWRHVDVYDDVNGAAHEVKTGRASNRQFIEDQLDKDCALLADGESSITSVTWHFLPSLTPSGRYRFGPDSRLLDAMLQRVQQCPGFSFRVYPPA